jgi:hypothetical protein
MESRGDLDLKRVERDRYDLPITANISGSIGAAQHVAHLLQQLGLNIPLTLLKPIININGKDKKQIDITRRPNTRALCPRPD